MAQLQKVEGQRELKCDARQYFDVWVCKPHLTPNICPNKLAKVELLEGQWHKAGAVINWTYLFNEKGTGERPYPITTRYEELDEKNMKLRYSYDGGFILKNYYKCFKSNLEVTPKGGEGEGCIVKWCMEYEKMNEDVPEPNIYIDFLLGVAKDIDAYCLCNA